MYDKTAARAKLLAELMSHLEDLDGEGLREKMMPAKADLTVVELDPKKTEDFKKGFNGAMGMPKSEEGEKKEEDKGPMEKLMESKGDKVAMTDPDQDDEMDDDELNELISEHMKA